MRYPGRVLATDETPPRAMLKYVAEQIGVDAGKFALYARREETRRDHIARLMVYLAARSATGQDRGAALLASIHAATMSDDGGAIASATVAIFVNADLFCRQSTRSNGSVLPPAPLPVGGRRER